MVSALAQEARACNRGRGELRRPGARSHSGVIYRASNFQYLGVSADDKGFRDPETGKTYHSRALRTKYNGDFKPFVKKLRAKHEAGLLEVVELPGKHCYTYAMKAKRQNVK